VAPCHQGVSSGSCFIYVRSVTIPEGERPGEASQQRAAPLGILCLRESSFQVFHRLEWFTGQALPVSGKHLRKVGHRFPQEQVRAVVGGDAMTLARGYDIGG